jgi:hypothetical protein
MQDGSDLEPIDYEDVGQENTINIKSLPQHVTLSNWKEVGYVDEHENGRAEFVCRLCEFNCIH